MALLSPVVAIIPSNSLNKSLKLPGFVRTSVISSVVTPLNAKSLPTLLACSTASLSISNGVTGIVNGARYLFFAHLRPGISPVSKLISSTLNVEIS